VDILKKQFSLASTPTTPATLNNRPPHKWQATLLEYDLDVPAPIAGQTQVTHPCTMPQSTVTTTTVDYATKLMSIKAELKSLHTTMTDAMEQIQQAIASINTTSAAHSSQMETDADSMDCLPATNHQPTTTELLDIMAELRHDIATIVLESQALSQQQAILQMPPNHKHAPVTYHLT